MRVWCVSVGCVHEGSSVSSVWSSEEMAFAEAWRLAEEKRAWWADVLHGDDQTRDVVQSDSECALFLSVGSDAFVVTAFDVDAVE